MSQPPAPLSAEQTTPGADPDVVLQEYLGIIQRTIAHHPRSLQAAIGPSEVGQPCARRIGYRLLGKPQRDQEPNWKAAIGTAVHSWLERAFDRENLRQANDLDGQERWLVETRLTVGSTATLGTIEGSCDLYDRATGTVIDHKIVGPSQLRHYRADGPGQQYRWQAHLYGHGWQLAGHPAETVAICFLPRNGDLRDAYLWHEPYDAHIALDALRRLEGIATTCQILGDEALQLLPTAQQFCALCPWYQAGSTDPATGCPGHDMPLPESRPPLTLIK